MEQFHLSSLISKLFVLLTIAVAGKAEVIEVSIDSPQFDRWMYPFNATAGSRELASTFSSVGGGFDIFDDRDGQILLGFVTQDVVSANLGSGGYDITSAQIRITISSDYIPYDPTVDEWETYAVDGEADTDTGRPMELYGAAFRGGFDGWSFGETGPFPFGAERDERNAYPIAFSESNEPFDVSNSVTNEITPEPFAVGTTDAVQAGSIMPSETVLSFDLNVADASIQCYLRNALNDGLLNLVVTSLHDAEPPLLKGSRGAMYPNFHMKESLAVIFEFADAAQCDFTVVVADEPTIPEDVNGDGVVSVADLLQLIADWGMCNCCPSDIDGNGEVNVVDLLAVIAMWS